MPSNVSFTSKPSSDTERSQKRCCSTIVISVGYLSFSRLDSTTPEAAVSNET